MSDRPRVFVSRRIPEAGICLLDGPCEIEVWPGELPPLPADLADRVRGCDGLLCLLSDRIDQSVLDAAGPTLKVISLYSAGFNNVDIEAATKRRVLVTNTPDQLTETTAELAFALMMAAARRFREGIENVTSGQWKTWGPLILRGYDLRGSTIGIVGMGRIGAAMARRAAAFDMRVVYYDPSPFMVPPGNAPLTRTRDIDELLSISDFVSLHCPLTPETRHLINARSFRIMKRNAVLINTGRGPCVDTDALVEALSSGRIFAAGLDVTDPEPLPPDHPLVSLPNCLIVPHVGSATFATRDEMAVGAARNLLDVLNGIKPVDTVNPEAWE